MLDEVLKNNAQAAALLQNKQALQDLLHSSDTQALIALLQHSAGKGLQSAADAAVQGDTSQLMGLMQQIMSSQEGAAAVARIQKHMPKK